jgi:nickel transport protein
VIARTLAVAAVLALGTPAAAHEVRHEVVRGRAVAVRVTYADGEPLAYAEYQVFAPSDPRVPFQKGRTDRVGWLAFVPSERGAWRVQVADATGHGLTVEVAADPGEPPPRPRAGETLPAALRPIAGVALVAAIFGALFVAARRRRSR